MYQQIKMRRIHTQRKIVHQVVGVGRIGKRWGWSQLVWGGREHAAFTHRAVVNVHFLGIQYHTHMAAGCINIADQHIDQFERLVGLGAVLVPLGAAIIIVANGSKGDSAPVFQLHGGANLRSLGELTRYAADGFCWHCGDFRHCLRGAFGQNILVHLESWFAGFAIEFIIAFQGNLANAFIVPQLGTVVLRIPDITLSVLIANKKAVCTDQVGRIGVALEECVVAQLLFNHDVGHPHGEVAVSSRTDRHPLLSLGGANG